MLRKWLSVALIGLSLQAFAQENTIAESVQAEASSNHYISDGLFVFLHAGPGRNYRILGSVEAGTPITLLDNDKEAEFSKIRDNEDRTGWVETRFVSNQMSLKEQLPVVRRLLADSQASLQGLESENSRLKQQLGDAQGELTQLNEQAEQQTREISRLTSKLEEESKDEMIKWFTWGGIVAGGGVLLGVILTFLPKKRRRSDEWL